MFAEKVYLFVYRAIGHYFLQVKRELDGKNVALSFDCWSDRYTKTSFLGVVVRHVDRAKMCIVQRSIAVKELPHPHTSANIRAAVLDVMQQFAIDESRVVKIVGDNASNVRAAFTEKKTVEVEGDGKDVLVSINQKIR